MERHCADWESSPWPGMCEKSLPRGGSGNQRTIGPWRLMPLSGWRSISIHTLDVQLNFWLLLQPLTDGGEESSWHLACRLLSVWHWASALDLPTCPPAPSSLNIGHWLQEDCEVDERQIVDRGICMHSSAHSWGFSGLVLDCRRWKNDSGGQQPGGDIHGCNQHACISPCIVRECWPSPQEDTPAAGPVRGVRNYS